MPNGFAVTECCVQKADKLWFSSCLVNSSLRFGFMLFASGSEMIYVKANCSFSAFDAVDNDWKDAQNLIGTVPED